ncbi:MAG: polysaccharide biosynthesis protein [Planctomycetes bacterium]|nr:polysaccharide biosynthesis protein [Planctomycetota bacterium]
MLHFSETSDGSSSLVDPRFFRPIKIFIAHIGLFSAALFISFVLYSNMRVGDWFPWVYLNWLMVTLFVKLIVFGFLHQYQGWWRYASVSDLFSIMMGSHISALILVVGFYVAMNIEYLGSRMAVPDWQVPQAVMLMDWVATIVVLCGVRLAIRLYYEETQTIAGGRLTRILIVGAGNAGESLLRELNRMQVARYEIVGFIDDDRKKRGVRIGGVPVVGSTGEIKSISAKRNVDELIIAMPSASHKEFRRVIELCEGTNLKFSIIPDLVAIASGQVSVSQTRDVDINDLLGRDPVQLDLDLIEEFIKDEVVMITGAGGSIGSEMCRQVGLFKPKMLLLVEQTENGLFFIERELHDKFPETRIQPHVCDVTDRKRVEYLFDRYRPAVVIHAAAHKHVPLMEANAGEAIKNNVGGTRQVAQAAHKYKTRHFVMISTDKAVNPTSIMGSSKRLAEMMVQCLNERSQTDFVMVRFGNVLGSSGSVLPVFRQQIDQGGPVTVTHPEMKRYFMTIPEASQLVLQAAAMGRGGEVFVLDMGEPVKIVDLARDLITLSGYRPGEDIEIKFTGIRPGEKLFEELAITGEDVQPTRHPKIMIWKNIPTQEKLLNDAIERMIQVADRDGDRDTIIKLIKEVVPEYVGDVDSIKLHEAHQLQAKGDLANGVKDGVAEVGRDSSLRSE